MLQNESLVLNANPVGHHSHALQLAKTLQQYLKVEIFDSVNDSITQLARNGQKIEAVQLAVRRLGLPLAEAKKHVDKLGQH
jgi:ribosomal protein L7/L12